MSTVVFDAQDALLTALNANATIGAVGATLGYPAGGIERTAVWIDGGIAEWIQEWDTTIVTSSGMKHETFTLVVRIVAGALTSDYDDARDALAPLITALETVLTGSPTLSDKVMLARLASVNVSEAYDEASRVRQLGAECRIACIAYHA